MRKIRPVFAAFLMCFLLFGVPSWAKTNQFPYTDQFTDSNSGWEADAGKGWRTGYMNNGYEINLLKKDLIHAVDAPVLVPESYSVETKARLVSGNGALGLAFNVKGESGYLFIIGPTTQNYLVLKAKPDNKWEVLKEKTYSDDIQDGWNILKAEVNRDEAGLYVNGHLLTKISVDAGKDDLGLGLIAFSYSNNVIVHFESFTASQRIDINGEALPTDSAITVDFSRKDQGFSESGYYKIQNGVLHFSGGKDNQTWMNLYTSKVAPNCAVAVKVRRSGGAEDTAFGIIFRYNNVDDFYYFKITANGYFKLIKSVPSGWEEMTPWKETDLITDDFNVLKVVCHGPSIQCYLNDKKVIDVEDKSWEPASEASVGVGADSGVQCNFDDFAVNPDTADEIPLQGNKVKIVDFSRKDQGFSESEYFKIQKGAMNFSGGREDKTWLNLFSPEVAADCTVTVKAKWTGGAEDAAFGLVFRLKNVDDFYYFKITGDGYFKLIKSVESGWDELTAWKDTDLLTDSFNTLKVVCRGSSIKCYLNGKLVIEIANEPSQGDKISVGIAADSGVQCSFDDFTIISEDTVDI